MHDACYDRGITFRLYWFLNDRAPFYTLNRPEFVILFRLILVVYLGDGIFHMV